MKEENHNQPAWDMLMENELAKRGFGPSGSKKGSYIRHDPYFYITLSFEGEKAILDVNKIGTTHVSILWASNQYITLDSIMEEIEITKKRFK